MIERIMIKKIFIVALMALGFTACSVGQHSTSSSTKGKDISYSIGRNYFANTSSTNKTVLHSQREFNKLFSPAAVMGKDGEPTKINFSREMVIPFILPETNRDTEIKVQSVQKIGKELRVSFRVIRGEERSYTIRPMTFIILPKANYKTISINSDEVHRTANTLNN